MSLRGGGPIEELTVPSGTTVEEHDLVTDGDVLVGGQSTVEFGLRGRNVAIGERVRVEKDIEAEGDCRLDTWCSVDGNVLVGEDAYLGERVTVTGRLMVSGDLDIGDDVTIEEGFEANGWIVIRNPVPTLVFYFIVLSQLLRVGETDAADDLAEALADGDDVRDPLLVPRSAEISDDAWRVSTPATVGDDCRLHGNLRAESIRVGERNEVFGSLRAREGVTVGANTIIHGDVTTRGGTVTIEAGARILGDVSAGDLIIHDGAEIDGALRARGEMKLVQESTTETEPAAKEPSTGPAAEEPSTETDVDEPDESASDATSTADAQLDAESGAEPPPDPESDPTGAGSDAENADDDDEDGESDADEPTADTEADEPAADTEADEPTADTESDEPTADTESDTRADNDADTEDLDTDVDEPNTNETVDIDEESSSDGNEASEEAETAGLTSDPSDADAEAK